MQATRRVYRRPTEFIGSQVGLRRLYRQPGGSTATVQATRKAYGDYRWIYGVYIGGQVGLRRLYRQPGGSTATVQATRKVYGDCTGNPGRSTAST